MSNLNNFYSCEVVNRVSETQRQVGEKFKLNNLAVKGLMYLISIKNIHEYIYVIYIIMYIKESHCVCMMGPRK